MSREYQMGYFIPVAPEKVAAWEDYRSKVFAYRDALGVLQREIGAAGVWTGLGGSIVGAKFDGEVHLSFSPKTNKRGFNPIVSRGRSLAQKEAIASLKPKNEAVAALNPNPEDIAQSHGFAIRVGYETEGGGSGWFTIGPFLTPVQSAWFDPKGVIMIYAPDAKAAVDDFKESHARSVESHPDFSKPLTRIDHDDWKTPEGYERISESKWNLMKSTYEVSKEEAKGSNE